VTPGELEAELAAGRLRPAYLVTGPEPLLREDARRGVERAVFGEGPRDFDFELLDGERCTPAALEDALRVLPVLAPRRLVVLREPEGRRRGDALAERLETLLGSLDDVPSSVLLVTAERVDGRARWVRAFTDPAARVDCEAPRNLRDTAAWVRGEAARQSVTLAGGAAEALAERIGPQLLMLRQEIAKAALFAGPGKPVTPAHVGETASDAAEEPIWSLTDAIGEGRAPDALALLARMGAAGAPPPVVLGALASHFRKLARLRTGGRVAAPPFALRKLDAQAKRYTPARLRACLHAVHEADERLKGRGELPAELALERLVLTLAGEPRTARAPA
jgi:DNA polymerase-3 subunit delta